MQYAPIVSILLVMVTGCGNGVEGEDVVEKTAFRMPVKENTWVRKESTRKTSDTIDDVANSKVTKISIDPALASKLKQSKAINVKTEQDCADKANALNKRRIEVQKRGVVWQAYERNVKSKPYSNDGMQLDSQLNRLVFSVRHICKNAKGVRLDAWGTKTVQRFESMGKEGYTNYFLNLGEVPGDIDRWVRFAEFAIKSRDRDVSYSKIGESLGLATSILDLYDDLSQRIIIDDASLKKFITEGATLLSVINESFTEDPRIVLALQYEKLYPFEDIEGEM
ncbi:MAG: hypothetical protein F3740_10450 [Nitrospinae bacterium]|nr:hypothetical protein [Nitrospinota bacterium]